MICGTVLSAHHLACNEIGQVESDATGADSASREVFEASAALAQEADNLRNQVKTFLSRPCFLRRGVT